MTQHNAPTIEISLSAIAENYTRLKNRLAGSACAAVVKANAYGLGVKAIAPVLHDAGCQSFFVATLEEAMELRAIMDEKGEPRLAFEETGIYVFHGVRKGEIKDFVHHRILPVLNSSEQVQLWQNAGPCALHLDTGMRRLGLTPKEALRVTEEKQIPGQLKLILSHLACANDPNHPMNAQQLADFKAALAFFPGVPASLSNSSGIFLGEDYHFALARPGCSLYGISPDTGQPNPMKNVVNLTAPVLQYRTINSPQSVGYGATATVPAGTVLATVELGYADGFLRHLSNRTHGFAAGQHVPLVGRVSMDMVSVDVTAIPERMRDENLRITFIGEEQSVDAIAKDAGTIGYEIFTRLGHRVKRLYND